MIEIFLQPGEYYVGDANCRIRTLLGSCVSITLWQPKRQIGAMSHFLLASRLRADAAALDARYGDEALTLMLRDLAAQNVAAEDCQAKLFGGGNMFPKHARAKQRNVGEQNGEAAREFLRAHGIPLVSQSLYGVGHRTIIFDVNTGHVWSRQVKPKHPAAPEARKP
ncbi:MAG TPA: chemotaxis protein CheD [Polyangiales bacterium]|nr:chemotaxis protein CheD [Polyangiales bacterium]